MKRRRIFIFLICFFHVFCFFPTTLGPHHFYNRFVIIIESLVRTVFDPKKTLANGAALRENLLLMSCFWDHGVSCVCVQDFCGVQVGVRGSAWHGGKVFAPGCASKPSRSCRGARWSQTFFLVDVQRHLMWIKRQSKRMRVKCSTRFSTFEEIWNWTIVISWSWFRKTWYSNNADCPQGE